MKTLLFILIYNVGLAQSFHLDMLVQRIPANLTNTPSSRTVQNVHLIIDGTDIGLITEQDTLACKLIFRHERNSNLKPNSNLTVRIFEDLNNPGQKYWIVYIEAKDGIAISFAPLPPYKGDVYSISIRTIQPGTQKQYK
jgi:hypothetical protein